MSRRLRRVLVQLLILLSMAVVAVLDDTTYLFLVTVSVFVALPIAWLAAGVLILSSREDPGIHSLADAADNLVTVAINTTVAAGVLLFVSLRALGFISESVALWLTVGLGYIIVSNTLPSWRALQTWRDVWVPMIRTRRP